VFLPSSARVFCKGFSQCDAERFPNNSWGEMRRVIVVAAPPNALLTLRKKATVER
jgi:hypothetical protein